MCKRGGGGTQERVHTHHMIDDLSVEGKAEGACNSPDEGHQDRQDHHGLGSLRFELIHHEIKYKGSEGEGHYLHHGQYQAGVEGPPEHLGVTQNSQCGFQGHKSTMSTMCHRSLTRPTYLYMPWQEEGKPYSVMESEEPAQQQPLPGHATDLLPRPLVHSLDAMF